MGHTSAETTGANQDAQSQAAAQEPDSELERLRERLAFYESFDRLIQENIARSGDLLREAMDLREAAARELAEARAEVERLKSSHQQQLRDLLGAILDDLSALQGHAERAARRVADALDDVEASLPPAATAQPTAPLPATAPLPPLPPDLKPFEPSEFEIAEEQTEQALTALPDAPAPAPEEPSAPAAVDETISVAVEPTPAMPSSDEAEEAGTAPVVDDSIRDVPNEESPPPVESAPAAEPAAFEPAPSVEPAPAFEAVPAQEPSEPAAPPAAPSQRPAPMATDEALASTGIRSTILLVHGVPRATTALSLKRYLEGLGHVRSVEPREFAEGILRLQVTGHRPLTFSDLYGWPEGRGMEAVHVRDDLLEVRLPRVS